MSLFPTVRGDPRVNENLRICLTCETRLRLFTGADETALALMGQCPTCKTCYLISIMDIADACERPAPR